MKKLISFLILFLILSSVFSENLRFLFNKPGSYLMYNYNSNNELYIGFYSLDKYEVMKSSELLAIAWSQDRKLMGGQALIESGYYTHAISQSNAVGLYQIKLMTADDISVNNLFDPFDNLKGALEYHGYLKRLFNGDEKKAIAAYHDGPGAISSKGMTITGERYYRLVKNAEKNYKNTSILSPYYYGFGFKYYETDKIKIDADFGIAYKKTEFYTKLGYIVRKTQNNEFLNDFFMNYKIIYYPRTILAFGLSNKDVIIRLGPPWNQVNISFNENPYIDFCKEINKIFYLKSLIDKDNFKIGIGFNVFNLSTDLNYNIINNSISVNMVLRGASM